MEVVRGQSLRKVSRFLVGCSTSILGRSGRHLMVISWWFDAYLVKLMVIANCMVLLWQFVMKLQNLWGGVVSKNKGSCQAWYHLCRRDPEEVLIRQRTQSLWAPGSQAAHRSAEKIRSWFWKPWRRMWDPCSLHHRSSGLPSTGGFHKWGYPKWMVYKGQSY